jgi:gamma-glutamyltranspeptidase/glutathione hydrolase
MLRALELAWQRHGSLPWEEVLLPAIDLVKSGTVVNQTLVNWLAMAGSAVFFEQPESRETFFPDGATPLQRGAFYKAPHLDHSLELIAREGADALYRGELGRAFEQEITGNQGYVTMADLAAYQTRVRKPLASPFRVPVSLPTTAWVSRNSTLPATSALRPVAGWYPTCLRLWCGVKAVGL